MLTFVTIIHVLLCVFMIFVILLQPGKDAGMGSTLGGGAATTAFGGRGAVTFLSKVTAVCAGLFFLTSLGLSFVGLRQSVAAGGVEEKPAAAAPAPNAQLPVAPGLPSGSQPVNVAPPPGGAPAAAPAAPAPAAPAAPAPAAPAPAAPAPAGQTK